MTDAETKALAKVASTIRSIERDAIVSWLMDHSRGSETDDPERGIVRTEALLYAAVAIAHGRHLEDQP